VLADDAFLLGHTINIQEVTAVVTKDRIIIQAFCLQNMPVLVLKRQLIETAIRFL